MQSGQSGTDRSRLLRDHLGKTAALTEVCTRLGAEYAGATPVVADKLACFGKALGRAFQIADDLLDLTGDESHAGKTLGTDLDQGKLTLPLIHALNSKSKVEAEELRGWLRSNEPGRRKRIADYLIGSGSLVYAKKAADEQVRIARAALQIVPNSESRTLLDQLAEWSVRREK